MGARVQGRRRLSSLLVVLALLGLGGLIWVNRDAFTPLDAGSPAPDYTALSLAGDSVPLSTFAGDVVLLNIWATWCAPCVYEMPALQRLHEQLAHEGLRVVAVSVDGPQGAFGLGGEPGGLVAEFRDRFDLTFTILLDPSGRIQNRFQVNGLPTTFIIDRQGRIQRKVLGARDWDAPRFVDEIRALLGD
jgi:cytochrome c biogenesis protein CcmG, thiol:disulfide interchange protein DsbE